MNYKRRRSIGRSGDRSRSERELDIYSAKIFLKPSCKIFCILGHFLLVGQPYFTK